MAHKVFKIERAAFGNCQPDAFDPSTGHQHNQMMTALDEIKHMLAERPAEAQMPTDVLESFRADMAEAARIKSELDTIKAAIDRTKYEIAALHLPNDDSGDINRMTDELFAIVDGTEKATETILSSVEVIDDNAKDLLPGLTEGNQKDMASDIQDQVVKIYEACNFQDLTGQRISKVVRAFGFIEQRVEQMMDIWGGIESFKGFEPENLQTKSDDGLLNGPSLENDSDVASQDDIDALFD